MTDIIIIGAGPAGMTAALYATRSGKSVLVLEKETFGGQITYSPRVENYPGIKQISGNEWAAELVEQILELGVRTELEAVTGLCPQGSFWTVETEEGAHTGKAVILATGVSHRRLGLPREEELTGAGISYCAVCDGAFYAGERVAVVGGGDTALQEALFLSSLCRRVTVIHRRGEFRGEQRLWESLRQKDNVDFRLHSVVAGLEGQDHLTGLRLRDTRDGNETRLPMEGLFVAIGQIPHNDCFSASVRLTADGYLAAGEDALTSAPGIFAAGDCRAKEVRQLTTAVGDGAAAALAACRYIDAL